MPKNIMMQESIHELITLQNVYESASEIGEHFKKFIDLFGSDTFDALIPSVVRVLEKLEFVTIQRDKCMNLVEKLYRQIDELECEQNKQKDVQRRYQSEIEDIDELWQKENQKLEQYIKYLKRENDRLSSLKNSEQFSQSLIGKI